MAHRIHPGIIANVDALSAEFRNNQPFRHLVMENFFDADYCEALLASFPSFDRGNAKSENGDMGLKSTVEQIHELGPAFVELDHLIQTPGFLNLIGQLTGIPNLRYDPWYFGGGTHENRHGQDLDTHVDFNRHPMNRWHRRLNLIVYLNHEWDEAWGGNLCLHADPRSADDHVISIEPLFNRAVLFETTERSWHGFPKICLPEDHRSLSRKSIAFYFYSEDRPAEELADTHSTIYVDRPLPDYFREGFTLNEADVQELQTLITRRDHHIQRLYRDSTSLTMQLDGAKNSLAALQGTAPANVTPPTPVLVGWRQIARLAMNRLRH
jgi:2OG-Fe(II) oxygenase superfamily